MGDQLANAVGDHLMRAVVLSGIGALIIVALVALAWWQSRRWMRDRFDTRPVGDRGRSVTGMDERQIETSTGPDEPSGQDSAAYDRREDNWSSRVVRDAATRAAAMRDTWDRSYRAARTGEAERPTRESGRGELDSLIGELRTTNQLLRDLVTELRTRR